MIIKKPHLQYGLNYHNDDIGITALELNHQNTP